MAASEKTAPGRPGAAWAPFLLVALAVFPYLNTLGNALVYDDLALTGENDRVRSLDPRPIFLGRSLERYEVEWYRPLTIYTFALNYAVHGLRPEGYHVVNLALHASTVLLLYRIALGLLPSGTGALVAAGLFATHPIHVEAVAPASGRADLLATFFALLAGWLWLTARERAGTARLAVIALSTLAAFLSKESAVAIGVLLVVSSLLGRARSLSVLLLFTMLGYFALRVAATGGWLAVPGTSIRTLENPLVEAEPAVRLATGGWVLVQYLGLLLAPLTLSADYSFDQIPLITSLADGRLWATFFAMVALSLVLFLSWKRNPALGSFLVLFLVSWVPVSNTILPIGTIKAERLMYLPSAFLALAAGALACHRYRRLTWLVVTPILVAYAARTVARNQDWRSQETLFAATVKTAPRSAKARFNYGTELLGQGRLTEAAREFETALRIAPRYPEAANALGSVFLQKQDLARAEAYFRGAIQDQPDLGSAWANLGATLFRAGRHTEAEPALERAAALRPDLAIVWATLGALAENRGERERAIECYRNAYKLAPSLDGLGAHLKELLSRSR